MRVNVNKDGSISRFDVELQLEDLEVLQCSAEVK